MSDWTVGSIKDVCVLVVDCPHSTPKWTDEGVIVLRSKNIRDGRLNLSDPSFTDETHYKRRVRRAVPQGGDLVITREAPMGEVCMLPSGLKCCLGQRMVLLRPDPDVIDGRFLLFSIQAPQVQHQIRIHEGTGSTVSNLRIPALENLQVPLPSLAEQRRIAAVLGALDDKIELNRQMNRTLESMAQAIFNSWFIDFDGHDDLVESELGPIPRGWRIGKLGDIAVQFRETVQPDHIDPRTPYIGLADMPQGCISLESWGSAADVSSAKARFKRGDILFGKLRPYFKKVGIAPRDGVASSDILVIRPRDQVWFGPSLGLLTFDPFIKYTEAVSTGTRMPRVSWKTMAGYDLAIPPTELAGEYSTIVIRFAERILSNIENNIILAQLRNTLLPKLISGKLRVPEAEDIVETMTANTK